MGNCDVGRSCGCDSQLEEHADNKEREIDEKYKALAYHGTRGKRLALQNDHAFAFCTDDRAGFRKMCDMGFLEASKGDNKPLGRDEFEAALTKLFVEQFKELGSISPHTPANSVKFNKDDVKAWFKLTDDDDSGEIEKDEYHDLVRYVCIDMKLKAATALVKYAGSLGPNYKVRSSNKLFVMGGDCDTQSWFSGFTLTKGHSFEEGHLLYNFPMPTAKNEIHVELKYMAAQLKSNPSKCGEGMCIYLCNPAVTGYDKQFEGTGPCGFIGKTGAVCGVFFDLGGNICHDDQDHVCLRGPQPDDKPHGSKKYEHGTGLRTNGQWWDVHIKFDIKENKCDVKIQGKKVLDDVKFHGLLDGVQAVCVGVCAATSEEKTCAFSVKDLKISADDPATVPLLPQINALGVEIATLQAEMRKNYGSRGERAVALIEAMFRFAGSDEFKAYVKRMFADAAGGDDKLTLTEFEEPFQALLNDILNTYTQKAAGPKAAKIKVRVKQDSIKQWFKLIDADESGNVSELEFVMLVVYSVCAQKKTVTTQMLKSLQELKDEKQWSRYCGSNGAETPFIMGSDCVINTTQPSGFALTDGEQFSEGHLLCDNPITPQKELWVTMVYSCLRTHAEKDPGEGLCVYLADSSVQGYNTHYDGTGPCGFTGKKGAVVGVFLDIAGNISGQENTVCIRGAHPEDPILGKVKADTLFNNGEKWDLKVKFDVEENKCDVTLNDKKILDDVPFTGIRWPSKVVAGVCAGSSEEKVSKIVVNKVKLSNQK